MLLDYDGTLVPIASTPELAPPDQELLELLRALAAVPGTEVHVVSGRARDCLEAWLGGLPVGLHAEHGFWSRVNGKPGGQWQANGPLDAAWKPEVLAVMRAHARTVEGALIEEKRTGLAFHYRRLPAASAARLVPQLRAALRPAVLRAPIELLDGSRVLEVRPQGMHKGRVVMRLMGAIAMAPGTVVLAAGDDRTDEDMFRALPPLAVTVKVGAAASSARWRVSGPDEMRALLRRLVA